MRAFILISALTFILALECASTKAAYMKERRFLLNRFNALKNRDVCSEDYESVGGKCLKLVRSSVSWSRAKRNCEHDGARLLVLDDNSQLDAVLSGIASMYKGGAWLGLQRVSGGWSWLTGEAFDGGEWHSGEPDDEGEDCGVIVCGMAGDCRNALWDRECDRMYYYICEQID